MKVEIIKQDNTKPFEAYQNNINNFINKIGGENVIEIIPCNTCSTMVYRECIIVYKD